MHRRQFLNSETLARTAGEMLGVWDLLREPEEPNTELSLMRFSRRAMATLFEVLLPLGTRRAQEAADATLDEIDRLEAQLTVFRDDSEVSRINQLSPIAAIGVEKDLFELLCLCAELTKETEGAFDISTGALIKAWGFYKRAGRVPDEFEREDAIRRVGMDRLVLNNEQKTARILTPGLEINLGSIGKGYALDRAASLLRRQWQVRDALLHGGQSSICALGNEPGTKRGWRIGLVNPLDPTAHYAVVRLRDRALGTSGKRFQNLEHDGRRLGHILDPRVGWPAEGMLSASVIAPTAAVADALATAFFILGVDKAGDFCACHPHIGAVLVSDEKKPRPIAIGIDPADIDVLRTTLD